MEQTRLYDLPSKLLIAWAKWLVTASNWPALGPQIDSDDLKLGALRSGNQPGASDLTLCQYLLDELALKGKTVKQLIDALLQLGMQELASKIEEDLTHLATSLLTLPEASPSDECYFFLFNGTVNDGLKAFEQRLATSTTYPKDYLKKTTKIIENQVEFTRFANKSKHSRLSIVFAHVNGARRWPALQLFTAVVQQTPNLVIIHSHTEGDETLLARIPHHSPQFIAVDEVIAMHNEECEEHAVQLFTQETIRELVVDATKDTSRHRCLIKTKGSKAKLHVSCLVDRIMNGPNLFPLNEITFVRVLLNNQENEVRLNIAFQKKFPCVVAVIRTDYNECEAVVSVTTFDYWSVFFKTESIMKKLSERGLKVEKIKLLDIQRLQELVNRASPEDARRLLAVKQLHFSKKLGNIPLVVDNTFPSANNNNQMPAKVEPKAKEELSEKVKLDTPSVPDVPAAVQTLLLIPTSKLLEDVCFLLEHCFSYRRSLGTHKIHSFYSPTRIVNVCVYEPHDFAVINESLQMFATEVILFKLIENSDYTNDNHSLVEKQITLWSSQKPLRVAPANVRDFKEIHAFLQKWFAKLRN